MEEAFFNIAISPRLGQTDQVPGRSSRGPWPASLSSLRQSLLPLVLTRSVFRCCSFVAFGAIFLCRLPLAGVASHLALVAITGELVLTQGFWAAVGFLWRVALPESAEQVLVSQNIRVQDLDLLPVPRVDNRR